jgi:hypothetical protein
MENATLLTASFVRRNSSSCQHLNVDGHKGPARCMPANPDQAHDRTQIALSPQTKRQIMTPRVVLSSIAASAMDGDTFPPVLTHS